MSFNPPSVDADTIIVGAGIVGCSIAYHLAELGHTDVLVVDRGSVANPLGSTGHAPGLLGRNSGTPAMAALAMYSAELYARVLSDPPAFQRTGSVEVTRSADTLRLLARKREVALAGGIDAELVSPERLTKLVPYLDSDGLAGGLFIPDDGVLDVRRLLQALHEAAQDHGLAFREGVQVIDFARDGDRITGVITDQGTIFASRVIVAVGIWGRELAGKAGLDLALYPVQHPYLQTKPLPRVVTGEMRPFVRDLDNLFYLREHGDRLGYGWYNHSPLAAEVDTTIKADLAYEDRKFDAALSYDLFPILEQTGSCRKLNGIFSMTPDGAPLLGQVDGAKGLWVAEAVWVTHAGAVGKAMAECILDRSPSFDITQFHLDRFASMDEQSRRHASMSLYNDIYAWPAETGDPAQVQIKGSKAVNHDRLSLL
ncbi:FAD-binding oxidoreductase [Sphingosinicella sp. LHD-64]|uniref:NAD(P)/FAD-dependent oxidoreductase n=1 Tax=Sphingosinicella sp. LHD-64 TaxID=3072139 RepID=UPI00280D4F0F|nr:FAD-binding oxidoreductase [Sphingosinicella sp. LHD-64]MDQ8757445.1 FAD-binding oxidoreductase [Sphingosinicella sp. LHD-64]